jgi:hypothetical protein
MYKSVTRYQPVKKLAYRIKLNADIRAPQNGQGEAQSAGNGEPFSSTGTKHWPFCGTPGGQGDKRPSASSPKAPTVGALA